MDRRVVAMVRELGYTVRFNGPAGVETSVKVQSIPCARCHLIALREAHNAAVQS